MHTETITVATADGPMDAYVASPKHDSTERRPAMVVIQEAFGVNGHVRSVCERFAAEGYVALAPELFHRDGRGLTFGYDQFPALRKHFAAFTNEHFVTDINASLAALRARADVDPTRVGIMGECVGGFAAFLAACSTDVRACVSFYGGGIVHERPGLALKPVLERAHAKMAPTLCLFGADDQGITSEQVDAIRSKLASLSAQHEVVVYPNAGHGFFCEERASAYAEAAAKQAWPRALAFLRAHSV